MSNKDKSHHDLLVELDEVCEEMLRRANCGDSMAKLFLHEMGVISTKAFEQSLSMPTIDDDEQFLNYMATKASCPILITSNVKKDREDKLDHLFNELRLGSQSLHNVTGKKFRGGHSDYSTARVANSAISNLLNEIYALQRLNEVRPDLIEEKHHLEKIAARLSELSIDNVEDWFASIWDLVILHSDGYPEDEIPEFPIVGISLDSLTKNAQETYSDGGMHAFVCRSNKHKAIRQCLWRAFIGGVFPELGAQLKLKGKHKVTPAKREYQKHKMNDLA
jgi:hypothetical protein